MRLLNTKTLHLESFPRFDHQEIPPYAILSHRWGPDEVSFQEMERPTLSLRAKAGYYREADVCYVYLVDVPGSDDPEAASSMFRKSAWFTRGWTLQELLAPSYLLFYNSNWNEIGTKSSLRQVIADITNINLDALTSRAQLRRFSVAQRMSWASNRETERIEDVAYSLLGLFGVNMPLIYGEGEKAFHRLQLEILRGSDDESLFAWTQQTDYHKTLLNLRGPLARSPREFRACQDVENSPSNQDHGVPFSMTNKGLHISLPLFGWNCVSIPVRLQCPTELLPENNAIFFALLKCHRGGKQLGIRLQHDEGTDQKHYTRVYADRETTIDFFTDYLSGSGVDRDKLRVRANDAVLTELYLQEKFSEQSIPPVLYSRREMIICVRRKCRGQLSWCLNNLETCDKYQLKGKSASTVTCDIRKEETRITLCRYLSGAALIFTNDSVQQRFIIVFQMAKQAIRCQVKKSSSGDDFQELARKHCYEYKVAWADEAPGYDVDRNTINLEGGEKVEVAVRHGLIDGVRAYFVDVLTKRNFSFDGFLPLRI